ncbi:hypothetical protein [Streptomyces scabiei]|uniref:hypothetical protein n=1 Tax=Streptomyces scabiei TaxID=1930 RepID=UPI001B30DA71|nr:MULTISPECIES: hypothetical protein [Streptomyces]MBP5870882.1 hypothetical protein [Streptomyces sp. LBUM 1485]MBP5913213.1 hypothetical protein [Streptomyces sp. LBUM 1486]MDX2794625.1 hypothetical protein [Streptomyces scabiei]MDX3822373.1 hypothetical protein [Streptomyces scabiei]QTU57370.1 hypothetical protein F3K21_35095 [Streptomyces sp. LBUM 1480]
MTDRPAVNIEAILIGLLSVAHTPEQAEHAAKTVLGDHAHELAEQQRALLRSKGPVWTGSINQVINHIDPEAQQ